MEPSQFLLSTQPAERIELSHDPAFGTAHPMNTQLRTKIILKAVFFTPQVIYFDENNKKYLHRSDSPKSVADLVMANRNLL